MPVPSRPTLMILAIFLAVLGWGIFHAVGAFGYNHNPWRAVMVLGCFAGFLGLWALLLSRRGQR